MRDAESLRYDTIDDLPHDLYNERITNRVCLIGWPLTQNIIQTSLNLQLFTTYLKLKVTDDLMR